MTPISKALAAAGLLAAGASALQAAPPVERFTANDTYYIYYGNWDAALLSTVQANGYRVVILEPKTVDRPMVADLQNGADNILGNADDIRVYAYISFGEDNRPSATEPDPNNPGKRRFKQVAGGTGPRVDPRRVPTNANPVPPISTIATLDGPAPLGAASPGGTGYPSFYVDGHDTNGDGLPEFDGKPDTNYEWGGAFVNAGDPAWFTVIKNMTEANTADPPLYPKGNCGLDEIFTTTVGKGLACDGIFTDTIDTCAPDTFAPSLTMLEWTAPGYRQLMKTVKETYPDKFILQNRGTFFFRTDVEAYNFTTRPFVDGVYFESYYADSNDFDYINPAFPDNKWNVGKHMNAEADRVDGFTIFSKGYLEPRAIRATIAIDGAVGDWPVESRLTTTPWIQDGGAINEVWAANDTNYLYLRVRTDAGTNLNSSAFDIFFDTDDAANSGVVSTAGYEPTGAGTRIKSELLYQWGGLYSQNTGAFNLGQVGTATVTADPTQSEWEIRIPRNLVHPAGHPRYANQSVFGPSGSHILMLLTYDSGGITQYYPVVEDSSERNIGYRFEKDAPGSVWDDELEESQKTHGWVSYLGDKLIQFGPNTRAKTWNLANPDTAAPVWSTTANGWFRANNNPLPARTGVQEVIAGNGSATVRWDLADDQTRPVRYKVYYAPASPDPGTNLAAAPWQNTGIVSGGKPSNYKWGAGGWTEGGSVYANEHTVTGLNNGVTYKFIVRAVDSASPAHEDTNTVALTATPLGNGAYANITINGNFGDWPEEAKVFSDPQGDNGTGASDIKAIWVANDSQNIYMRVDTWNSHDFPNAFNNIYFDADLGGADTTFNPYGANLIASELLMQGGSLWSQKNGGWNEGATMPSTVGFAPFGVAATSWEWSIPRDLQHPSSGGNVFGNDGFKVLFTSGASASDEVALATATFGTPSVYKTIAIDGNMADWPAHALLYNDAQGDNLGAASDLKAVWMANDASYVYLRVDTWNSHDMPNVFNSFYFDTEVGVTPGFNPHTQGRISSKLLLNGAGLFSEGNGGYNDGYIGAANVSPLGTAATSWEYRIARSILHPAGSGARAGQTVFKADGSAMKVLLTSDNAGPAEFAPASGALDYVLASLNITPHSTNATITVDGNGAEWPAGAVVYNDAQGDNAGSASDVKTVWLANDANYIYLRVDTWNSHDYVATSNNTYLDTNLSAASGFAPHGLLFGSEMLLQNTGAWSQKNGGWNEGACTSPSSKTVTMAPTSGNATTWEWRIPRDLVHPSAGGPVFTASDNSFFLFVTSDNAGFAEGAPDNPANGFIWYIPAP